MSPASAAMPEFALPDLRDAVRRALAVAAGAVQVIGFAAALWLLAAGPGFLADHASTVPAAASH